jgi:hypothetical protein
VAAVIASGTPPSRVAAFRNLSFADAGFFYPDTQQQVVVTVLAIWLIGTGVLLARDRARTASAWS